MMYLLAFLALFNPYLQHHRKIFSAAPSISVVQSNGAANGTSISSLSVSLSSVASGDGLIAGCNLINISDICTITDSASQSWSATPDIVKVGATYGNYAIFHYSSSASGVTSVVCHSSANTGIFCFVAEISKSITFDQSHSGTYGATTSLTSGATPATTQSNEAVIGGFGGASGFGCTATNGYALFTNGSQNNPNSSSRSACAEYLIVSTTGAQTATATASAIATGVGVVATYY